MTNQKINIDGKEYEVLDAKEAMTVPDCFVLKNKIGGGHGEAKFYIGNSNAEMREFFDNFKRKCIFLKSDFMKYLKDAESEYKDPQQPYTKIRELSDDWKKYVKEVSNIDAEILEFSIKHQIQIAGPRMYINSKDEVYKLLRKIALPNVTYLSVLKIKSSDGEIIYYFKLFLDYFSEFEHSSIIKDEENEIKKMRSIGGQEKDQLVKARRGQGEYRKKLLEECPYCPITSISDDRLLIASHIKPWVKSDKDEKIDPKNGFMFTPTYDFLFDRGFISFNDDRTILISPWLSKMTLSKLNLAPGKKYPLLKVDGREKYLEYHRKNIFNGQVS